MEPIYAFQEKEEDWFEAKRLEMDSRSALVRRACQAGGDSARWGRPPNVRSSMILDLRHRVGFCRHGKVKWLKHGFHSAVLYFFGKLLAKAGSADEAMRRDNCRSFVRTPKKVLFLVFFLPFQVGTTTLLSHFLRFASASAEANVSSDLLHSSVPKLFFRSAAAQLEGKADLQGANLTIFKGILSNHSVYTFSFVRHPFERYFILF